MKPHILPSLAAALAATSLLTSTAPAALTLLDSAYTSSAYYTDASGNDIVAYDWDASGNLYYQSSDSYYMFGGFYRYDGTAVTTLSSANGSLFVGAGVAVIGQFAYYNVSDFGNNQLICRSDINTGATALVSSATNYGISAYNGALYIAGSADWATTEIAISTIDGTGAISTPSAFASIPGSTGPLTFDSAGNLYYAVGYGDFAIYKWSAAEVAAAIANPTDNGLLADGHTWSTFAPDWAAGATSMTFDAAGNLLVTFTNFSGPSELLFFGIDTDGAYLDGSATTLLTSDGRLGEIQWRDGILYVADGDTIWQLGGVIPEPASLALLLGLTGLSSTFARRRRS